MADTTMDMGSNEHPSSQPSAPSNMTTSAQQPITTSSVASTTPMTSRTNSVMDNATAVIKSEPGLPDPVAGSFDSQSTPMHITTHTPPTASAEASSDGITSQSITKSAPLEFSCLQRIIAEASPAELEKSIQIASTALSKIKSYLFTVTNNPNAARCLKLVEEAQNSFQTTRTVIGVIGETGAGKSSLINALLGTDKIVPTNCMRACTAVSTEISWNEADRPEEQFRAEIEFITPDEWLTELVHLFKDITDGSGEVVINNNKETDAGVAWAKIKSIYPSVDKDFLSKTTAKNLSRQSPTQEILGTTKKLNAPSANALYKLVQQYIDSKDNADGKSAGPTVLWPLIKVVRIYLKSEVLSTGAVLVDLPGVGDSNAARASVADKYLEKCDSIWIVAPIIRAVDNKIAQHLLGDTFKMQLKFDGGFSNVSFICSRTDEISVDEVVESLNLHKEYEAAVALGEKLCKEIQTLEAKCDKLTAIVEEQSSSRTRIERQMTIWQRLLTRQAKGHQVYAPYTDARKRKSTAGHTQPTKRRHSKRLAVVNDSDDEEEVAEEANHGEPLTAQQIEAMLKTLADQKINIKKNTKAMTADIDNAEEKIETLNDELESSKRHILSLCITERNKYSRTVIQNHFAHGIQMLDQETAMKNDSSGFDPDHKIRDYEEVARALPVFCVSSRAYQSEKGRTKSDKKFEGLTEDNTEIPLLLAHAQRITESRRIANCKKSLNCSLLVFQSLKTWLEAKDTDMKITGEEAEAETHKLKQDLCELRKMLDEAASRSVEHFKAILDKRIFRIIATAAKKASAGVIPIVEAWGRPVSEGGYFHATYKAVCVREGIYSRKKIDFNQDLIKPFKQQLATTWESTFVDAIPKMLDEFHQATEQSMEAFHGKILSRIQHEGLARRIIDLYPQLTAYAQAMKDSQVDFGRSVQEWQREASRELTPGVKEAMKPAYYKCAAESGTGSFSRMKETMLEHAHELKRRQNVFTKSTREVKKRLNNMLEDYKTALPERITAAIENITSDYLEIIQQSEDVNAPEDTRLAIIDILSRLDPDINLAHMA